MNYCFRKKNHVAAKLFCCASGMILPPFIIFKGKTTRGLKKVQLPKAVVYTVQAKAWIDEKCMIEWINKVWLTYVGKNRALLCLVAFSPHLTKQVRDEFAKNKTTLDDLYQLLVIDTGSD